MIELTSSASFDLAIETLAGPWGEKLRPLVGEPYSLGQWRQALRTAMSTGPTRTVKTVFRIDGDENGATG